VFVVLVVTVAVLLVELVDVFVLAEARWNIVVVVVVRFILLDEGSVVLVPVVVLLIVVV